MSFSLCSQISTYSIKVSSFYRWPRCNKVIGIITHLMSYLPQSKKKTACLWTACYFIVLSLLNSGVFLHTCIKLWIILPGEAEISAHFCTSKKLTHSILPPLWNKKPFLDLKFDETRGNRQFTLSARWRARIRGSLSRHQKKRIKNSKVN